LWASRWTEDISPDDPSLKDLFAKLGQ